MVKLKFPSRAGSMKHPQLWSGLLVVLAAMVVTPSILAAGPALTISDSSNASIAPRLRPVGPETAAEVISLATPGFAPNPTPDHGGTVSPATTPSPVASQVPALAPALAGATLVSIRSDARGLLLTVNDQPVVVTGMDYDVNYTSLPEETRRALHERDFQIMKSAGVNAIVGWGVYDEVTLQIASEFGIGVIMPFDLDPQGAYDNQNYRNQVMSDFRAYVERFKGFPAVWGWNPGGDELLYRMDTQQHRTSDKLQAAADLLAQLSALAYSLDPAHVDVIKEPRDFYIPYLDAGLKKIRAQSGQPDPSRYVVFGLDVYGKPDDVAAAVQTAKRNAESRMGVALLVTEYGPFEMPAKDRAIDYGMIWDAVIANCPNGGLVYVFGPDQPNPQMPNPYDPLHLLPNPFTLVDNQGKPIDETLSTLTERYLLVHSSSSSP